MKQDLGKTGNAELVKVGHTTKAAFGADPNAQARGAASGKPTEQTFGGK